MSAVRKEKPDPSDGQSSTAGHQYIECWDTYFLAIAMVVSLKSKDPHSKVGAVVVNEDNLVVATGYNGLARGVFDSEELLRNVDEKLKWICHAEMNAILNAVRVGACLKSSTIYVNKFPCFTCCNAIVQSGISRIYTHDTGYWKNDPVDSGHERKADILKQAGIIVDAPFHDDYVPGSPLTLADLLTAPADPLSDSA